jgi:formiminotetrahydrofolate cyclodeaminase
MQAVLEEAELLRAELTAAVKRDSAAFEAVMEAFQAAQESLLMNKQHAARLSKKQPIQATLRTSWCGS